MTRDEIGTKVRSYLRDAMPGLEIDFDALSPHERLWDILGSLNLMDLVAYLESAFSIDVAPLDFIPENFESIDQIIDYVAETRNARGA